MVYVCVLFCLVSGRPRMLRGRASPQQFPNPPLPPLREGSPAAVFFSETPCRVVPCRVVPWPSVLCSIYLIRLSQPMVQSMKVGSVTVDLAAATGGNIATTRADEVRLNCVMRPINSVDCVCRVVSCLFSLSLRVLFLLSFHLLVGCVLIVSHLAVSVTNPAVIQFVGLLTHAFCFLLLAYLHTFSFIFVLFASVWPVMVVSSRCRSAWACCGIFQHFLFLFRVGCNVL